MTTPFSLIEWSESAERSMEIKNAGGKSTLSEKLSIEYFARLGATEFLFEMEIVYWINFSMVDFICSIEGERVGVSVTRALTPKIKEEFTKEDAVRLIDKKVRGLIVARNSVVKAQRFFRSYLQVWCMKEAHALLIREAFEELEEEKFELLKGELTLITSVYEFPEIYYLDRL